MTSFADIPVTMEGLLAVLYALVAVMIIVVLYHVLFIVSDLRKITKRFEDTTAQIESVILKPLAIIDEAFSWMTHYLTSAAKNKKHKSKSGKPFDVEEI